MLHTKPSDIFIHAIKAKRHEQEIEADNIVRYTFDKLSTAFLFAGKCLDLPEFEHFVEDEEYIFNTIFSIGYCPITKVREFWEGVYGCMDGELNRQMDYSKVTFANYPLDFYEQRTIGEDVWILQCDSMRMGLIPLISKYANILAYNEKTIELADIMSRMSALISAPDDKTKQAADQWLTDLKNGKMSAIGDNAFFDGIKAQPLHGAHTSLTDLIEVEQYFKASLNNELGLNANFNMKREAINSGETEQQDNLSVLMDSILLSLKRSCEKFNKATGFDLDVIYNPEGVWGRNERKAEAETEIMEAEVEHSEETTEEAPETNVETSEVTVEETTEETPAEETQEESQDETPEETVEETSEETEQADVSVEVKVVVGANSDGTPIYEESEVKKDDDESTDERDSESEDDA